MGKTLQANKQTSSQRLKKKKRLAVEIYRYLGIVRPSSSEARVVNDEANWRGEPISKRWKALNGLRRIMEQTIIIKSL